MNLLGNQFSYRGSFKNLEMRTKDQLQKRIFGKDITNVERKTKNTSIYEKQTSKPEVKVRSQSFNVKRQPQTKKDPIQDHETDILNFISKQQAVEKPENQKEITDKMRQILIDWLIDVHESFQLRQQTLHLALSYLNQFVSEAHVSKEDYQLVGITCLWIASKFQQIYPPSMQNYIAVTADAYNVQQIKKMEGTIIEVLNFNLNSITCLQLLQSVYGKIEQINMCFCKYVLEVSLLQNLGKKYCPAVRVLAAVALTDSVYKTKTDCSQLRQSAGISKENILLCFRDLCGILENGNKYQLKALKRKFQKERYHGVSKIRIQAK